MECNPADIMRLLKEVADKTGHKLLNAQFPEMYGKMKKQLHEILFAEDYMYKKMFLRARKNLETNTALKLKDEYLEKIAEYLGYKSYDRFLEMGRHQFPVALENCRGTWYSYVRCNSGNPEIFVSPVFIYPETKQLLVKMKGFTRIFEGELKMIGSCLNCLLESDQEKNIHLVLKIGLAKKPNVLQGVFSGLSSGGDPIAGREVWVRSDEGFDEMKNKKMKISELLNSRNEDEKIIGEYFSDRQQNILKGGQASTFEINDLKKK